MQAKAKADLTARIWTCPACKCEAVIPPEVPLDAEIVCPVCVKAEDGAAPRRRKVAIVGFADSWPLAPFHNPDWEVWCLNQFYDLAGARVDFAKLGAEGRLTWFDLHSRYDLENDPNVIARHPEHLKKLAGLPCPVYMQEHHEDIPNSVQYPKAEVLEQFGGYFTNSISWMLALAIRGGFTEIGLYGVNMAQESEYGSQRPSCEYLCGWARALGVTLRIPPQSDLLHAPYLYGYEDDRVDAQIAKIDQLLKEHTANQQRHQQLADENTAYAQQFNGAIQQLQVLKRNYLLSQ